MITVVVPIHGPQRQCLDRQGYLGIDKPSAVLVSGAGVARKPEAIVVYQDKLGRLALTMTDGKVTTSPARDKAATWRRSAVRPR